MFAVIVRPTIGNTCESLHKFIVLQRGDFQPVMCELPDGLRYPQVGGTSQD